MRALHTLMVDVVARAQRLTRHLVLLRRQLVPRACPVGAELGDVARGPALAVKLVLEEAVVLPALAAGRQVAVVVRRTALPELIRCLLAEPIHAWRTRASWHALRIVRTLLVAREAPVGAAMRGCAVVVRVRAQLPTRAQPIVRVRAHSDVGQRLALCIIIPRPAEAAEAIVLAALALCASLVPHSALLPSRTQPSVLLLTDTSWHRAALRKHLADLSFAAKVAAAATTRI